MFNTSDSEDYVCGVWHHALATPAYRHGERSAYNDYNNALTPSN